MLVFSHAFLQSDFYNSVEKLILSVTIKGKMGQKFQSCAFVYLLNHSHDAINEENSYIPDNY